MRLLAFSVYDEKVMVFAAPFFQNTVGQALRSFQDAVNDPQVAFSRHPGDYVLYQVGVYEDSTGEFGSQIPPVRLGVGTDFVNREVPG